MREVHDAHQPEDQREARGYEKIERTQRDAAQQRIQEDLLAAPFRHEFRRPGSEDKPEEDRDEDRDDQAPDRIALDDVIHRGGSRKILSSGWPRLVAALDRARMAPLRHPCLRRLE